MNLDSYIESILFFKGEAISLKTLAKILAKEEVEIEEALKILEKKLEDRGIRLLRHEDLLTLGTAPRASEIIETLTREELSRDLGKAGLETLSIILYRGPIARKNIDYIRGVNSQAIVRNLLIRGLIEKVPSPEDQRSFLYKPTLDLLSHLGITKIEDLPEYVNVKNEIEKAETTEESTNDSASEREADFNNQPESLDSETGTSEIQN